MNRSTDSPGAERMIHALEALLPPGTAVAALGIEQATAPLLGPEVESARTMVPARRREFAAGRHCARQALVRLGGSPDQAIPRGTGRNPLWPAGIVGSISHGAGLAAAALAPARLCAGLGIDIEEPEGLDAALVDRVALPVELASGLPALAGGAAHAARILFSAKESAYKCVWPLTGRFLEFHDLEMSPRNDRELGVRAPGIPEVAELAARLRVAWIRNDHWIITAAWMAA
jgi:4'-phosphopantetheinyl transferase EntD